MRDLPVETGSFHDGISKSPMKHGSRHSLQMYGKCWTKLPKDN